MNPLLILSAILLFVIFIYGAYLMFISILQKRASKRKFFIGLLLCFISVSAFFKDSIINIISPRPNIEEIVGTYKIASKTSLIRKFDLSNAVLVLKKDGTFSRSSISMLDLCSMGEFALDYAFDNNEIAFKCEESYRPAHIKNKLFGFSIEFNLGATSNGDRIVFKKID